jgi:ATP-dependent helicase/nuclease subunit B
MLNKICNNLDQIDITINTLVLTANQRLALRTHQAYDKHQVEQGMNSWLTPFILPLNTWLNQQAAKHIDKIILNNHQELCLWEDIIRQSCDDSELLNPTDTASTAASALQTLHLWNVPLEHLDNTANQEVAMFYQWALQFSLVLSSNQFITSAQLAAELKQHVQQLIPASTQKLILIGFDEFPPALLDLITQLENQVDITSLQIEKPASSINKATLHDQKAEIKTMAHWAKQQMDSNPDARIGCIVPQLEKTRRSLYNAFTDAFNPLQILPGTQTTEKQFNISAGQRINEYPIIRTAIDAINSLSNSIEINRLGQLLQSPYIHLDTEEKEDAALIDAQLRKLHEYELPFSSLFEASTKVKLQTRFIQRLYDTHNKLKLAPQFASLQQWKIFFSDFLQTVGWPGYRTLNSEEYQLCIRWRQLLEEFTQLQLVCDDQVSLSQALYLLNKQAANTIFQSEGSQANVQILGVLEAAGNNFDSMWVMGLDDETWPSAPQPSPFIPYTMQAELAMPHATAERELLYTQQMMQRLCHSAELIIFSSPQYEGDKHKTPSQLITIFPDREFDSVAPHSAHDQRHHIEKISDDTAPPLQKDEVIKGGAWILKQQSECPFKAFSKIRLHAEGLESPYFGIAAHERGNLTHDVLERLWKQLETQDQLNSLSTTELTSYIDKILLTIMDEQSHPTNSLLKQELLELEKTRICALILEWLETEKRRAPFTVAALESTQRVTLGSLTFTLRIDRIDQLHSGEKIVIDYKTGYNTINSWLGERPSDPQLPLYATINSEYSAIIFGEVRGNQCSLKGLTASNELAKQLPGSISISKLSKEEVDWSGQLNNWQESLKSLVQEFENGIASVTPTSPSSCNYCDLQALCRVEINT